MRVLVCGGREFQDYLRFVRVMHELNAEHGPFTVVVHGGAKGADWCAKLWANSPIGARRGSQRGENEKLFPTAWDGLPQHYRDLLTYVAEFSRLSQIRPDPNGEGEATFQVPLPKG